MNEVTELSVMHLLKGAFEEASTVTKEEAWIITRISSKALSLAYFLSTNDCYLVQLDKYGNVARTCGSEGVMWIRVSDLNINQADQLREYLPLHREGTVASDDNLYIQVGRRTSAIARGIKRGF